MKYMFEGMSLEAWTAWIYLAAAMFSLFAAAAAMLAVNNWQVSYVGKRRLDLQRKAWMLMGEILEEFKEVMLKRKSDIIESNRTIRPKYNDLANALDAMDAYRRRIKSLNPLLMKLNRFEKEFEHEWGNKSNDIFQKIHDAHTEYMRQFQFAEFELQILAEECEKDEAQPSEVNQNARGVLEKFQSAVLIESYDRENSITRNLSQAQSEMNDFKTNKSFLKF